MYCNGNISFPGAPRHPVSLVALPKTQDIHVALDLKPECPYLVIEESGSALIGGKSHIGGVPESSLEVHFFRVEPLWMAYYSECTANFGTQPQTCIV